MASATLQEGGLRSLAPKPKSKLAGLAPKAAAPAAPTAQELEQTAHDAPSIGDQTMAMLSGFSQQPPHILAGMLRTAGLGQRLFNKALASGFGRPDFEVPDEQNWFLKAAKPLEEYAAGIQEQSTPEGMEGGFFEKLGGMMGGVASLALGGPAARAVGAAETPFMASTMAASSMGPAFEEAKAGGAGDGEAATYALAHGAISAGMAVPLQRALNEAVAASGGQTSPLMTLARNAANFGAYSASAKALGNAVAPLAKQYPDAFDGVAEEAVLGILTGGVLGFSHGGLRSLSPRKPEAPRAPRDAPVERATERPTEPTQAATVQAEPIAVPTGPRTLSIGDRVIEGWERSTPAPGTPERRAFEKDILPLEKVEAKIASELAAMDAREKETGKFTPADATRKLDLLKRHRTAFIEWWEARAPLDKARNEDLVENKAALPQERLAALERVGPREAKPPEPEAPVATAAEPPKEPFTFAESIEEALANPDYRAALSSMAKEAGATMEEMSSRDATGNKVGGQRTWVPKSEWWPRVPRDSEGNAIFKSDEFKAIGKRVESGKPWTPTERQREVLEFMLHEVEYGGRVGPTPEKPARAPVDPERLAMQQEGEALPPLMPEGRFPWEVPIREQVMEESRSLPPEAQKVAQERVSEMIAEVKKSDLPPVDPPGPPRPMEPVPDGGLPDGAGVSATAFVNDHLGRSAISNYRARVRRVRRGNELKALVDQPILERAKELLDRPGQKELDKVAEAGAVYMDTLGKIDTEYARFGEKLKPEHRAALERARNMPEKVRGFFDRLLADNRAWSESIQDSGVIHNVIDNYTKRLWKSLVETVRPRTALPKASTFTTGSLKRTYSSILEGWANGRELAVKSALDQAFWNEIETERVQINRDTIRAGKKLGIMAHTPQDPTWKMIDPPGFKDWQVIAKVNLAESPEVVARSIGERLGPEVTVPVEEAVRIIGRSKTLEDSTVLGRDLIIKPDGTILHKDPVYATPEVAEQLNRIFGTSGLAGLKVKIGDRTVVSMEGYDAFTRTVRNMMLTADASIELVKGQVLLLGTPVQKPGELLPWNAYAHGKEMIGRMGQRIEFGVKNSLNLGVAPEYSEILDREISTAKSRIDKVVAGTPGAEQTRNFFWNILRAHNNWVLRDLIPAMKAHVWDLEYRRQTMKNARLPAEKQRDAPEMAQGAARMADNMFSGQNLAWLRRNPTTQHVYRSLVLTPDWTESSIRAASDAFRAGAVGEAHRMMWRRAMTRYALAWAAFNMAGAMMEDPKDPGNRFLKNMKAAHGKSLRALFGVDVTPYLTHFGRKDPKRIYLGIMGTFSDPLEAVTDPAKYVAARIGIVPRMGIEAAMGMDPIGQKFTTMDELTGTDDQGLYQKTQFSPTFHLAGTPKGGKLEGETVSWQSSSRGGPIAPSQYPSYALFQMEESMPVGLQSVKEAMNGQIDGWEAALRAIGMRVTAPRQHREDSALMRRINAALGAR